MAKLRGRRKGDALVHRAHTLTKRKPMASARRVSLFDRKVEVRLSAAAHELLFADAKVLSEGQADDTGYIGSTMVSIEVGGAAARVSDPCDATTVRRLAELLPHDEAARTRARQIALVEARRRGSSFEESQIDLRVRAVGSVLHLDLDVEARRKR